MELTKQKLQELYENNTNDKLCEILGVSKATLLKYLKDAEIPLKGKGGGFAKPKIQVVD